MHFGIPGTINSSVSSQGITVMAASPKKIIDKADDTAWEEIFESLIIENEPPTRYIKNVIIQFLVVIGRIVVVVNVVGIKDIGVKVHMN